MSLPHPLLHVSAARGWRGGEQQLVSLAERLHGAGVPQTVVCVPGSPLERALLERGVAVAPLSRRLGADPRFARALARAARSVRAALVHAHDAHAHTAAVLAATAFGLDVPVVVHRRVDFPLGHGLLSAWKYEHASVRRIVCVSEGVARVVRRDVADRGRVVVVHDGVDPARFPPRPAPSIRTALGVPENALLVGNIAALVNHKDHFTFLATAARLVRHEAALAPLLARHVHFLVVGDGPLRATLEARARKLGLADRVRFLGFREDVPAILPALDLFLFTSKEEGLGSSILDAWACRVPVVATAAGGIPELVRDGETGLLAPVRDAAGLAAAVRRVLSDGALRAALVERAAARLADFGADRMAQRTLVIYREVLARDRAEGAAIESATRAFGSLRPKSRFQR